MKKIILVAKAASGKTFLAEEFEKHGYGANLSVTTRPMRDGEEHMKHYNFMSPLRFLWNRLLGRFWETKKFNGWRYGTLKKEWEEKQVFIFTPEGCQDIYKNKERDNCYIVYLNIAYPVRHERLSVRSDADSVSRRLAADEAQFKYFLDYDHVIYDPEFNPKQTMHSIIKEASK